MALKEVTWVATRQSITNLTAGAKLQQMSWQAKQDNEGPGTEMREWEPARKGLFSKYSAFTPERSIPIGEK